MADNKSLSNLGITKAPETQTPFSGPVLGTKCTGKRVPEGGSCACQLFDAQVPAGTAA